LGWWGWDAAEGDKFQKFTPYIYQYSGASGSNCALDRINAVNVVVRRTDQGGGAGPSVFLTLAKIFGWDTANVVASSTASIGYMFSNCSVAPIALCANYWSQIESNLGKYYPATFRTGANKPAMLDEQYWVNPCQMGAPSSKDLRDWIDGKMPDPPCFQFNCIYCNTGEKDSVTRQSVKPKLEELYNARQSCSEEPPDPWFHYCEKLPGTEKCLEGWLITVPVLPVNPATGDCDCDKAITEGVEWKPVVIRAAYTPDEVNNPNSDVPQAIRDACAKSQAMCYEIASFPCPVTVQGNPGGTTEILATRPKLVQFDWYPSPP
jgi:hypothetical protein